MVALCPLVCVPVVAPGGRRVLPRQRQWLSREPTSAARLVGVEMGSCGAVGQHLWCALRSQRSRLFEIPFFFLLFCVKTGSSTGMAVLSFALLSHTPCRVKDCRAHSLRLGEYHSSCTGENEQPPGERAKPDDAAVRYTAHLPTHRPLRTALTPHQSCIN